MAAGICPGPGIIQSADLFQLSLVTLASVFGVIRAFIQNSPDINTGVIEMGSDHFPVAVLTLFVKIRIAHHLFRKAAGMIFLPDQDSLLITQIQENFIIGIMAGAHGICSQILHHIQIIIDGFIGKGTAKQRMILMAAKSLDQHGSAIDQNFSSLCLHDTHTDAFHPIVCGDSI